MKTLFATIILATVGTIFNGEAHANNRDRSYAELASAINVARRVPSSTVSLCDAGGVTAFVVSGGSLFNCVDFDGVTVNGSVIATEVNMGLTILHRIIKPLKTRKGFRGDCGGRSPYRNVGRYSGCYLLIRPTVDTVQQKAKNGSIYTHFVIADYSNGDHLSITVRGGKGSGNF